MSMCCNTLKPAPTYGEEPLLVHRKCVPNLARSRKYLHCCWIHFEKMLQADTDCGLQT
jgi:hypothetical protein